MDARLAMPLLHRAIDPVVALGPPPDRAVERPPRLAHRYWVPMLGNAFRVLEAFGDARAELSLQDVTTSAKITKTSAFRILFTLGQLGYVTKDARTGRYRLGRQLFEVAQRACAGGDVAPAAQPHMRAPGGRFGETISLCWRVVAAKAAALSAPAKAGRSPAREGQQK